MALTKISTAMISQSAAAVDLNVDAGTFYVDTTNNRVGVGGKTDPDTPLHVVGTATATLFAGSGASLTSIPNSALVNSSITINSTAVSLGGSLTLTTANIGENTNLYYTDARADARIAAADTDDLSEGSSNLYYTDARVDARVSGGSLGNITTTGYIRGPSSFTIDPAAHGDDTGTVVIAGNLQVDGTTTTINSTTMTVDDKNITLASGSANAAAASGAGFTVDIGTGTNPAITYDGTNDTWDFNKSLHISGAAGSGVKINSGGAIVGGGASGGDTQLMYWGGGPVYYGRSSLGGTVSGHEFRVGGVTKLNVNSSGNTIASGSVGIGTSSPSEELHIETTGGATAGIQLSTTGGTVDRDWKFLATAAAGTFFIQDATASVNRVAIDTSGNVGIGTTAPTQALDVRTQAVVGNGTDGVKLTYSTGNSSGIIDTGFSSTALEFRTGNSFAALIDSSGNVGIGTQSPDTNLHVYKASAGSITASSDAQLVVENSGVAAINLLSGASSHGQILFGDSGDADDGQFGYDQTNREFYFKTAGNSTKRLLIDSSGNVGIGTTSPDSKLDVEADEDTWISRIYNTGSDANAQGLLVRSDATAAHDAAVMGVYADGGYKMLVKSTGNVGIGTSSPGYLLTVKKDVDSFIMKVENDGNSPGTSGASYADASDGLWVDTRWNTATNTPFKVTSNSGTAPMMIIKGNGNVGIGNTGPANKLSIGQNLGAGFAITADSGTPYGMVLQTDEATPTANPNFWVRTNDGNAVSTLFRIQNNGLVGIGTSSPQAKLHVNEGPVYIGDYTGTVTPTEGIFLENAAGNSNTITMYTYGASVFKIESDGVEANIGWGSSGDREVNFVNTGAGDIKVGIGTTSPDAQFEVEWTGTQISTDSISRITAPIYPSLEFYSTNTNTSNRNWKISSVYNSYGTLEFLRSSAANGVPNITTLAMNANGNVGIGTHVPETVHGGKVLQVSSATGADVVVHRDDTGVELGDYIGGFLFYNGDTSGVDPHYSGMIGKASDIYGSSNLEFYAGRGALEDHTNAAPHMIIVGDSGDNSKVGIGETDPQGKLHIKEGDAGSITANTNFDQLILEDDQHSGMQIWSGSGYDGGIYFGDPSGPSQGQLKYKHSTESFEITANNGTPSLNIFNTVVASEVDVSIKNGKKIELQTTSGVARGFISAQETNTGGTHSAGLIIATSSGEAITFKDNGIGGTTNMIINGVGDVMIGNTVVNPASGFANQKGFGYNNGQGSVEIAVTSDVPVLQLGRNVTTASGNAIIFRKESNTYGSIGIEGGDSFVVAGNGASSAGIHMHPSQNAVVPAQGNARATTNTKDLGRSATSWRNIYLGTGIVQPDNTHRLEHSGGTDIGYKFNLGFIRGGSGGYNHIKTNLPYNGNKMMKFEFDGWTYSGTNYHESVTFYTYNGQTGSPYNPTYADWGNGGGIPNVYYSSDGYVVIVIQAHVSYTGGFLYAQCGRGHYVSDIQILATGSNSTTSGVF